MKIVDKNDNGDIDYSGKSISFLFLEWIMATIDH